MFSKNQHPITNRSPLSYHLRTAQFPPKNPSSLRAADISHKLFPFSKNHLSLVDDHDTPTEAINYTKLNSYTRVIKKSSHSILDSLISHLFAQKRLRCGFLTVIFFLLRISQATLLYVYKTITFTLA